MRPTQKSPLEGHVRLYEEQWQTEHALAMGCRTLEDALELGISLGDTIVAAVRRWREAVARGVEPCTQEDESGFLELLRYWSAVCQKALARVAAYEHLYDAVDHAAGFREQAAQVEQMMTTWTRPVLQRAAGLHVQDLTASEAEAAEARVAQGLPRLPLIPRSLGETTT